MTMGREERRQRGRVAKQLRKRLGRAPTEEEIDAALAELQETQAKEGRRRADGSKPKARPFAWRQ
jgi:DNA-directed RNA polymerase specialized sigma subunit